MPMMSLRHTVFMIRLWVGNSDNSKQAYTRMVASQEHGVAQTRAGMIETMWKAALTAGAVQVVAASSAFAADVSDDVSDDVRYR